MFLPISGMAAQFAIQPGWSIGPIAKGCAGRDAQYASRYFHSQPGEVSQFHEFGGLGIGLSQAVEGLADRQHVLCRVVDGRRSFSTALAVAPLVV